MAVNEKLLDERLEALERAHNWSPRVISKLETLIRSGDDRALYRINPITYGAERNIPENEAIDLFIHAAHVGLFDMNWYLLCPACSQAVKSLGSLQSVHTHYRCDLCHDTFETVLDDFVEISFTVNETVRPIVYHHPDKLSIEEYYFEYQLTAGAKIPAGAPVPEGTPFKSVARMLAKVLTWVEPGETLTRDLELGYGFFAGCDRAHDSSFAFQVGPEPGSGPHVLTLRLKDNGIEPAQGKIPAGPVKLTVVNDTPARSPLLVLFAPGDPHAPMKLVFDPFLTGKRLLTTQAFRDLFRGETIRGAQGLGVRDLTLLFTDLKGSTALYDRIGDLKAYALVQQHFDTLSRVIAARNGAIVKTIGDAVMATFLNPVDGLRAALEMRDEIEKFNARFSKPEIMLKLGLHRGASIAVTLNDRLDYFGQTVNIASRVQGLADAEEIYITQDIFRYPGVEPLLKGRAVTPGRAQLKGVAEEMQVYKIAP